MMKQVFFKVRLIVVLGLLIVTSSHLPGQRIEITESLQSFFTHYVSEDGRVDYKAVKSSGDCMTILSKLASVQIDQLKPEEEKAFLINAYNTFVICGVSEAYPVNSVQDIPRFFIQKSHLLGDQLYALDELEKEIIMPKFEDARLHFALNCGAVSCPPLWPRPFSSESLDEQLDSCTSKAMSEPNIFQSSGDKSSVALSRIFKWYASDFGGEKGIRDLLKSLNLIKNEGVAISYLTYDWSLNEISNMQAGDKNSRRYIISAALPRGGFEVKWFNNAYTEINQSNYKGARRASYFTSSLSALYGWRHNLSVGFDVRFRKVAISENQKNLWHLIGEDELTISHTALSTFGPKMRWAPNPDWPNFSIQSALWWPLKDDLEGNADEPYLDWNSPTWITQFFNDFDVGTSSSFFLEVAVFGEDLGFRAEDYNRWTTAVTGIYSYFPKQELSVYTLGNIAPSWLPELDIYGQLGLGLKYQITRFFEVEGLYTFFTNAGLIDIGGRAATYNIGIRWSG